MSLGLARFAFPPLGHFPASRRPSPQLTTYLPLLLPAPPSPPFPPPARQLTTYRGNYDVFVKTSAERLRNAQKAAESQAMKRAHIQVGG